MEHAVEWKCLPHSQEVEERERGKWVGSCCPLQADALNNVKTSNQTPPMRGFSTANSTTVGNKLWAHGPLGTFQIQMVAPGSGALRLGRDISSYNCPQAVPKPRSLRCVPFYLGLLGSTHQDIIVPWEVTGAQMTCKTPFPFTSCLNFDPQRQMELWWLTLSPSQPWSCSLPMYTMQ